LRNNGESDDKLIFKNSYYWLFFDYFTIAKIVNLVYNIIFSSFSIVKERVERGDRFG